MRHLTVTDSDMIESIAYIAYEQPNGPGGLNGTLEVVFKSSPDTIYRYEKVSAADFVRLISAPSLGSSFAEQFKKTKHPFTKSQRAPTLKK